MGVVESRSANSYDHVCASATTVSRAEQRALASDRKFQALVINGIAQEVRGRIQLAKIELGALQFLLQAIGLALPYQVFLALPYALTLAALAGVAGRVRAPAALARVEEV